MCSQFLYARFLEQEMDMMHNKREVLKRAQQEWSSLWVPAILQYAESCSGKLATVLHKAMVDCEGVYACFCSKTL